MEAELIGTAVAYELPTDVVSAKLTWTGAWQGTRLVGAIAVRHHTGVTDIYRLVVAPTAFRHGIARLCYARCPTRRPLHSRRQHTSALALHPHGFRITAKRLAPGDIHVVDMSRP